MKENADEGKCETLYKTQIKNNVTQVYLTYLHVPYINPV